MNNDPLAELDGLEEFATWIAELGVDPEERKRSLALLSVRRFTDGAWEQEMLTPGQQDQCLAEELVADEEQRGLVALQKAESKSRQ